ncbi:protein kinase [Herbiconiux sp. P17]|uniref:protein kinase domain-containing protein n=1 Tax=Herbiconiux wuyangfengii TaxID=3342794 RepID=UPI0035B9E247
MTDSDAPQNGLLSGRFRLGGLLGSGGSASVYEAVDVTTGETVALKVLHPHLSRSDAARDAFFAEARAAEVLLHPNIVGVRGVGVHLADGEPLAWIALEHAPGTSLAELVDHEGALRLDEALAMADGVLSALAYAHAAGLIHRDVSPANVMVARDPRGFLRPSGVRLVDFGLADAAGRAAVGADVLRTPDPSGADAIGGPGPQDLRSRGVLGNVNFLSPEQARGEAVDERGDVYQLGAVLYFALVGHPPFVRDDPRAVMLAHVQAPPPVPSVARRGTPRAVDRLVVRALLKDPELRFASADEMLVAVRSAARHLSAVAVTEGAEPGELGLGGSPHARTAQDGSAAQHTPPSSGAEGTTRVMPLPSAAGTPTGALSDAETTVLPRTRARARTGSGIAPRTGIGTTSSAPGHGRPASGPPGSRPPVGATASRPASDAATPRGRFGLWLILGLAACVVVVAWALASGTAPPPTQAAGPETEAPPSVSETTPPPPPSPTASTATLVPVPELASGSLSAARDALAAAGLTLGTVTPENSALAGETVLQSDPVAGSALAAGGTVNLVVASGSNAVPRIAGSAQADALATLRSAGFETLVTTRAEDAPPGTVLGSSPADGTVARIGTTVSIVIATPRPTSTPTTPPPPTSTPTPDPTETAVPRPPAGG